MSVHCKYFEEKKIGRAIGRTGFTNHIAKHFISCVVSWNAQFDRCHKNIHELSKNNAVDKYTHVFNTLMIE